MNPDFNLYNIPYTIPGVTGGNNWVDLDLRNITYGGIAPYTYSVDGSSTSINISGQYQWSPASPNIFKIWSNGGDITFNLTVTSSGTGDFAESPKTFTIYIEPSYPLLTGTNDDKYNIPSIPINTYYGTIDCSEAFSGGRPPYIYYLQNSGWWQYPIDPATGILTIKSSTTTTV